MKDVREDWSPGCWEVVSQRAKSVLAVFRMVL